MSKQFMRKLMAITVLVILLISGCRDIELVDVEWTVYEKIYTPSTSGTAGSIGWSFADKGGPVYVGGSPGSPERYTLILTRTDEEGNTRTKSVNVSSDEYVQYEIGDTYTTEEYMRMVKHE